MRVVIALLLAFTALLPAACNRQSGETEQAQAPGYAGSELIGRVSIAERGTPIPDLVFADDAGRTLRLTQITDVPVLVNLWATWCAPCIAEMPTLDALAEQRAGDLRVLTVSEDFQGADVVTPYFAEHDFARIEPWLDPDNAMMSALGLGTLPVTIMYDENGRELFRVYGGMDWSGERAERLIDGALGE